MTGIGIALGVFTLGCLVVGLLKAVFTPRRLWWVLGGFGSPTWKTSKDQEKEALQAKFDALKAALTIAIDEASDDLSTDVLYTNQQVTRNYETLLKIEVALEEIETDVKDLI